MRRLSDEGRRSKLPRVRHVWRGLKMPFFGSGVGGGRYWPERWVVYVVQVYEHTGWVFYVRAELRGICRPWVWHDRRGEWLPPRLIRVPGAHVNQHEAFSTLGAARSRGLGLAMVLMSYECYERKL